MSVFTQLVYFVEIISIISLISIGILFCLVCAKFFEVACFWVFRLFHFFLNIFINHSEGSSNRTHCVKIVRIWSYSGSYSVRMQERTNQNNSKYGHFLGIESQRSVVVKIAILIFEFMALYRYLFHPLYSSKI